MNEKDYQREQLIQALETALDLIVAVSGHGLKTANRVGADLGNVIAEARGINVMQVFDMSNARTLRMVDSLRRR